MFSRLTSEELSEIYSKLSIKRFKKNEVILHEEDTNKYMYIILKGRVKVVQTTEEGREIVLSIHESGDTFGEISLIDGMTSVARVMAATNSLVATISREDFNFLLFSHDKILQNLLHMLCARLRENVETIRMLNLSNAAQRIHMLFIKLAHDYGTKAEDGILLSIKLTHNEIANMTGLTRETVTRIMKKWQQEGHIRMKERKVFLKKEFLDTIK